jgi:hypothetical protein
MLSADIVDGLKLSLSATKAAFRAGERIVVEIRIENVHSAPVSLIDTFVLRDYRVRIERVDGKPVGVTSNGGAAQRNAGQTTLVSAQGVTLAPGQSLARQLPLSDWYELAAAGDYDVTVERNGWGDADRTLSAGPLRLPVE